jgi:hypothetical protein
MLRRNPCPRRVIATSTGGGTRNDPTEHFYRERPPRCAGFPRIKNITHAGRRSSRKTGIIWRISESALMILAWTFDKCFAHSVL